MEKIPVCFIRLQLSMNLESPSSFEHRERGRWKSFTCRHLWAGCLWRDLVQGRMITPQVCKAGTGRVDGCSWKPRAELCGIRRVGKGLMRVLVMKKMKRGKKSSTTDIGKHFL